MNKENEWYMDRRAKGSLFERGQADSYYNRAYRPHYGGAGLCMKTGRDTGPKVEVFTPEEREEYKAGYDNNEFEGIHKDWR